MLSSNLLNPNTLPQFMTGENADINSTLDDNKTQNKTIKVQNWNTIDKKDTVEFAPLDWAVTCS